MADYGAHAAVVDGVVGIRIVKRRLQNARGENNFVHGGVVVGVDGGRGHAPFVAVHGLADFGELAGILKSGGPADIRSVRITLDIELGIIAPFIGIADLDVEGFHFGDGGLFCFRAHPGKSGDIGAQRGEKVVNHLESVRFGGGRKIFLDVHLAQRFADIAIDGLHAALPAGLKLRGAGKALAVEIKIFLHEIIAERREQRRGSRASEDKSSSRLAAWR